MTLAATNWGMIGMMVILGTVFVVLVWNAGRKRKGRR